MSEHVIHTRADGLLAGTTAAEVAEIARAAAASERVVIHVHGGLVGTDRGMAIAARLAPEYERAGAFPVFFVWGSGLLETISGNLREILLEDLGRRLLRWLLRFTVGKLSDTAGSRAGTELTLPYEMEVNAELRSRDSGQEPYAGLRARAELPPVGAGEREQFEQAVGTDDELAAALEAVLAGRHDAGTRGATAAGPARTLMSPEVLAELDPDGGAGERGLISTALLAKKAGAVFAAVIARFRSGTDHGVYPTVVEEMLREFYLANCGAAVWAAMKRDTADTFIADDRDRGGALFLRELRAAAGRPELSVVGHSTGAVFIDHLLDAMAEGGGDLRLRNVVMLAPACTFDHLAAALRHQHLVDRFRLFTMDDASECKDHLVPGLYPRSLLYLVSGVLERDSSGASVVVPVAGLQRYHTGERFAGIEPVRAVRDYLGKEPGRLVWSPSPPDALAGLRARANSHGGFDDDPDVLDSIRALVAAR